VLAVVSAAVVGAAMIGPSTASAGAEQGKVTVVHAVPDLTVDVYANDGLLLEDFMPGAITSPVALEPGDYEVEVTPANSSDVALSAMVPVTSDTDAAGVAYLTEAGDPTLGLFANNQSPIKRRKARITVRHTAAAPEVDVRVKLDGEWVPVVTGLPNGEQATLGVRARTYKVDVVLAGTDDRVLGPARLELERRRHYFVYAWGSAADQSLALNLSTRRLPVKR
jgi:hypothetical protein